MTASNSVFIEHSISSGCDPFEVYGNATFTLRNGGSLTIDGDLDIYGNATVEVDSTSSLTINGDLNVAGNGEMVLTGTLVVNGDVDVSGSGSVCGTGLASVSGSISGSGWCYEVTVLPIELMSFSARLMSDQSVELLWQTASEVNNDHFVIERSSDGMTFVEVGYINGQGNSNTVQNYSFTDRNAGSGTFYYRLTQVDFDGQFEHFEMIAVTIEDDQQTNLCTLEVNPNPCVPWCEARLADCPNGGFRTHIMDAGGNIISELIPEVDGPGGVRYHINRENFLMPGVYVVHSANDKARLSKKVIVK